MKKVLLTIALTTSLTLAAAPAFGAWIAGNAGQATVSAAVMPAASGSAAAAPTPAANSSTVQVTFSAVSFKGAALSSHDGGGYVVSRFPAATGGSAAATTTCSSSPCSVAGVPDGIWYVDVSPALQNWRGAATATRAQVVVDTTPPSGLSITGVGAVNNAETLSGNAGIAGTDQQSVTVVVCATNTFPCANSEAQVTSSVTNGSWSWTTHGLGNKKTHYAQVTQSDATGNVSAAVFGPFTT
jgi:hypothetical protein